MRGWVKNGVQIHLLLWCIRLDMTTHEMGLLYNFKSKNSQNYKNNQNKLLIQKLKADSGLKTSKLILFDFAIKVLFGKAPLKRFKSSKKITF